MNFLQKSQHISKANTTGGNPSLYRFVWWERTIPTKATTATTLDVLHEDYDAWCTGNGLQAISPDAFAAGVRPLARIDERAGNIRSDLKSDISRCTIKERAALDDLLLLFRLLLVGSEHQLAGAAQAHHFSLRCSPRYGTHPTWERCRRPCKREDKDDYWLNLGACYPHEDGEGFNLLLDALPVDGHCPTAPEAIAAARPRPTS